jgi:AraC-like DNA-binding protein
VLPDGCMDLIWTDGRLIVAGPDTQAYLPSANEGRHFTGLRFAPGSAPGLLGVPAHELRNTRVPLEDIWPSGEVRRLGERIAVTGDPGTALEALAHRRSIELPREPPLPVAAVVNAVRRGVAVPVIARAIGLSERQLRRRSLDLFGYGPKMLGRILRMNRALELARAGRPLAEVSVDAGYADQAHLTREVKALAGVPPAVLLGESATEAEPTAALAS